jgi:hypothetical protein
MIFCRVIAFQQPVDIAILSSDITIKTNRNENMCGDHQVLRIQVAYVSLSLAMLATSAPGTKRASYLS